jgi:hypothetical protein
MQMPSDEFLSPFSVKQDRKIEGLTLIVGYMTLIVGYKDFIQVSKEKKELED